jgi:hypothetical protein
MKPISLVAPGLDLPEIVIAKDQPQYIPLPAVYDREHGVVHTRWKLSLVERFRVLICGSMYLSIRTFNEPLQPVKLSTKCIVGAE